MKFNKEMATEGFGLEKILCDIASPDYLISD